jgi:protein-S-isoprenylcysteine O-methyltransferase Ste14
MRVRRDVAKKSRQDFSPPAVKPHRPLSARLAAVGRRIFHRRMHIGLAAVTVGALCIRPRPLFGAHQGMVELGCLALVAVGLAGRAWAAGCAGPHTRRATIEAPRLATGGPYAFVRNPIYLASIVLGLGMVGLLGDLWMLVPYVAVFVFLYGAIVPAEEEALRRRFPEGYARYAAAVPRLVPRLRRWPGAQAQAFEWSALLAETRLAVVLAIIYFVMRGAARWRGFV